MFVCLSPETRTTDGGGGLSHRPFGQHTTRTDLFAGPVAGVCPISVCCPSHGYFSKNKQDSCIVTLKHYLEVGIADSVAAFRSSSRRPPPWGDILVSNTNFIQILFNIFIHRSDSKRSLMQISRTLRQLEKMITTQITCTIWWQQMLSIDQTSSRRRCCQLL